MSGTETNPATNPEPGRPRRRKHGFLPYLLVLIVPAMFIFAFWNIKLFRIWCEHYGIAVAPNHAAVASTHVGRQVAVMFTGVVATGLPVEFQPDQAYETIRVGQRVENHYTFINPTDHVVHFRAIHSILPYTAAKKLAIMQCFCFTNQTLQPHQTKTLPVIYQLNPGLPADVAQVRWNYTLFPQS